MRPVTTIKHYVQNTLTSLGVAAAQSDTVVQGVALRGTDNDDVLNGSVVKNIFIERWLKGDADNNIFGLAVIKLPSALASPTFASLANLNDYANKKNILFVTYGTLSAVNPAPVIRQWIKIPPGKQRIGVADRIVVTIWSQAIGLTYCGFVTYKEYV